MQIIQSRRDFLAGLSVVGAAGCSAHRNRSPRAAAGNHDGPYRKMSRICVAPQYVAEELLRAEGFTDVRYLDLEPAPTSSGDRARRAGFRL